MPTINSLEEIKHILITGADGLLGSNLTRELLNRQYKITALVQEGREPKTLEDLNINIKYGDITRIDSLNSIDEPIDAIYHLAANTSLWPYRSNAVNKVNIEGTRNVIDFAKDKKVKKLIYFGTANSFTFGDTLNPGVEDTPYICHKYGLDYMDSKYKAQQMVLAEAKNGLPVIVLNPTFMMGKYDTNPNTGALIVAVYKQKLPGCPDGGKNFICIKDVSVAAANALTMGRDGECYILGNENLTYREIFAKIGKCIDVKPPRRIVPKSALLALGLIQSRIAKIIRKPPVVSYALARISCEYHYYSSEKAVRELKLPQSPIEEGIHESYQWMMEEDPSRYFS